MILVPGKFNVLLTRLTSLTSSQEGSRLGSNRVLELREVFDKTWWREHLWGGSTTKGFFLLLTGFLRDTWNVSVSKDGCKQD